MADSTERDQKTLIGSLVSEARDDIAREDMAKQNIYQRLHAVTAEIKGHIAPDKQVMNNNGKLMYEYMSHDAVTAHVRASLNKHRIMVLPEITDHTVNTNRTELTIDVWFINVDDPKDKVAMKSIGYGVDPSDKGPGKAFSYAMKIAYQKMFLLNTADDIEEHDVKHDPAVPRTSDMDRTKGEATEATIHWAEEFRAELRETKTLDAVRALVRRNRKMLDQVPEATQKYFETEIERRKTELKPSPWVLKGIGGKNVLALGETPDDFATNFLAQYERLTDEDRPLLAMSNIEAIRAAIDAVTVAQLGADLETIMAMSGDGG